jgi:glutaredoxin
MPKAELFGTASCPWTRELREWLEWKNVDFEEYDVELDAEAFCRMHELTGGQMTVPVWAEDGKVMQIGWQGRGCVVARGPET